MSKSTNANDPPHAEGVEASRSRRIKPPGELPALVGERLRKPQRVANYELLSYLGQGGIGVTYLGRRLDSGRPVAVKAIQLVKATNRRQIELFEREAEALKALDHSQIPTFHETMVKEGAETFTLYLVQEFVEGHSLFRRLTDGHRFGADEVVAIMLSCLEPLSYLHRQVPPLYHRDIKPSNIIQRPDGSCVLIDFGGVREALSDPKLGGSSVVGTFGYMAPEQFQARVCAATDLYSLGATAVHLLSDIHPADLEVSRLKPDIHADVDVDPLLAVILDLLLEPAAEDRYQSAESLKAALGRWKRRRAEPVKSAHPTPKRTPSVGPKRGPTRPIAPVEPVKGESPRDNRTRRRVGAAPVGAAVSRWPTGEARDERSRPVATQRDDRPSRSQEFGGRHGQGQPPPIPAAAAAKLPTASDASPAARRPAGEGVLSGSHTDLSRASDPVGDAVSAEVPQPDLSAPQPEPSDPSRAQPSKPRSLGSRPSRTRVSIKKRVDPWYSVFNPFSPAYSPVGLFLAVVGLSSAVVGIFRPQIDVIAFAFAGIVGLYALVYLVGYARHVKSQDARYLLDVADGDLVRLELRTPLFGPIYVFVHYAFEHAGRRYRGKHFFASRRRAAPFIRGRRLPRMVHFDEENPKRCTLAAPDYGP